MSLRSRPVFLTLCFAALVAWAGTLMAGPTEVRRNGGQPQNAAQLFSALGQIRGFEATFREEKSLALLRAPLVSKGKLFYSFPGSLVRQVEHPKASMVRIGPGTLSVDDGGGARKVDLKGRPDVKLFVESFARVLAGDHQALSSIYDIQFLAASGDKPSWLLKLVPKPGRLAHLVKSVELAGKGFAVSRIVVVEAQGDRSVTTLLRVDPSRTFTPEEHQKLFGVKPAGK